VLEMIIFFVITLFVIGGGAMVILSTSPALQIAGFMFCTLSLGGEYLLLHQSYLFLAQTMVVVGAIVVLTAIVITSINQKESNIPKEGIRYMYIVISTLLVTPFGLLIYKTLISILPKNSIEFSTKGDINSISIELFSNWILPFEILSVLLLASLIGAVAIGRKDKQ